MNSTTRNELLEKLHKNEEYSKLETSRERIEFIFNKIMDYKYIESAIKTNIDQAKKKVGKNLPLAKCLKSEADLYMQQSSLGNLREKEEIFKKALASYTKAILFTPVMHEPEMASRLFFRKSQVHLFLDQAEAALYSIDTSLDILETYTINEKVSTNLHRIDCLVLKTSCLKKLNRFSEAIVIVDKLLNNPAALEKSNITVETLSDIKDKLSKQIETLSEDTKIENSNEKDYFSYRIDPRCTIRQSPVVGRHFVALEEIPEKTVILEEKPYSIIIEYDYLQKKCSTCYKELNYKFFPCLHCTELVFCNRKCFIQSYELFHRFECGFVQILKNITSPSFHVFRMVSRIGPVEAFEIEHKKNNYSIDDYVKEENQRLIPEINKTKEERSRAYKMSSILWDHNSKHSFQANVHHTIIGIEIAILLDTVHNFFHDKDYEFKIQFIEMLIVDTRRIIFNVFGWHEYNDDWSLRGHVANCQCLVGTLINHSCVPNTNWEFNDGQIKFTTNKLIKAGEEITITYGPNKDIPYNRRQERLNHYFFACKCQICVDDAKKSTALKCSKCEGPVPFDMPLNSEPNISGQCLLCFQKYPEFESSIEKYKKYKGLLKSVQKLAPFSYDKTMISKAKELVEKFAKLTTQFNPNLNRALMVFTNIIRNFPNFVSENEVIDFGFFIDSYLPIQMEVEDQETLDNLYFWNRIFQNFLMKNKTQISIEQKCQVWKTMAQFQIRILQVLNDLKKNESNAIAANIIQKQISNLDTQIKSLEKECDAESFCIGLH